jgi:hypothetical protein
MSVAYDYVKISLRDVQGIRYSPHLCPLGFSSKEKPLRSFLPSVDRRLPLCLDELIGAWGISPTPLVGGGGDFVFFNWWNAGKVFRGLRRHSAFI